MEKDCFFLSFAPFSFLPFSSLDLISQDYVICMHQAWLLANDWLAWNNRVYYTAAALVSHSRAA
jgi:hypothetical protein